jgi:hypothetical protein
MRAYAVRTGTIAPGAVLAGTPARPAPKQSRIAPDAQTPIKQGVARNANSGATLRLPATPLRLRLLDRKSARFGRSTGDKSMRDIGTSERSAPGGVLTGWISRLNLALELDLTVDTLRRWEARRFGPPCVRAGRKVYYRRDAVQDWLQQQELTSPRRAGGRR